LRCRLHLLGNASFHLCSKSIVFVDKKANMAFAAGVFTVNDSWFATRKHRYVSNFRFDNNSTLVGEGDFKLFQGASIYVVPDANLVVRGSGTFFNTNWERVLS